MMTAHDVDVVPAIDSRQSHLARAPVGPVY
jgi:hypothetical protein